MTIENLIEAAKAEQASYAAQHRTYSVYLLASSACPDIPRYVGMCYDGIPRRLAGHLNAARRNCGTPVCVWINYVMAHGHRIETQEIERGLTCAAAADLESRLIVCLSRLVPLMNVIGVGKRNQIETASQ